MPAVFHRPRVVFKSRFDDCGHLFLRAFGRIGVRVIVPPSWTSRLTSSPGVRCASSMMVASKMMPCELPTLVMVLTMM